RHSVHALENPSRHEKSTGDTEHDDDGQRPSACGEYDIVQTFPLFEIAPNQETESGRQLKYTHESVVLCAIGIVQAPIGGFRPAGGFENPGRKRSDVARQPLARARGHEVKARSRPTRSRVDDENEAADTALAVLLSQAGDFGIDRLRDLLGDQPPRVPSKIGEQESGKQREYCEIN